MYLLVFKKPTETQVESIRETFSNFDWSIGFAVEEIVVNDMLHDNLLIQFVSFKEFIQNDGDGDEITLFPETVEAVLTGKGQFYGALRNLAQGIEELESYFAYLGVASENRDAASEVIFSVKYDKYSTLTKSTMRLEELINS
jgi:hypothetical protein